MFEGCGSLPFIGHQFDALVADPFKFCQKTLISTVSADDQMQGEILQRRPQFTDAAVPALQICR